MCFWSMIISSAALLGLATAASAGMTVGLAASEPAIWTFLVLGLSSFGAAVSQPRVAPVRVARRRSRH